MEIIEGEIQLSCDTALALGNFDGVHLGHRELIERCKLRAKERGLKLVVITFTSELTNLKIGSRNSCITSKRQKQEHLRDLGVDILYIIEFNELLRSMSYESFVEEILISKLKAKEVFVGFNFRFGCGALGRPEHLERYGDHFNTTVVDPITIGGEVISSSVIRECIRAGRVKSAIELLGRPYTLRGLVSRGKGRGSKLGFATANLDLETDYIPPKFGVYETITVYDGVRYRSITNLGKNPTFGDVLFSVETHIIDFEGDIYGEEIEVEFLDHIRDEVKFSSVEELVAQVKRDIDSVKSKD